MRRLAPAQHPAWRKAIRTAAGADRHRVRHLVAQRALRPRSGRPCRTGRSRATSRSACIAGFPGCARTKRRRAGRARRLSRRQRARCESARPRRATGRPCRLHLHAEVVVDEMTAAASGPTSRRSTCLCWPVLVVARRSGLMSISAPSILLGACAVDDQRADLAAEVRACTGWATQLPGVVARLSRSSCGSRSWSSSVGGCAWFLESRAGERVASPPARPAIPPLGRTGRRHPLPR